jgi:polar amino acid transport system ATP-binding protein
MTMMAASHEMLFVRDVANRVIFRDDGVIVEQGDPASVLSSPKSERLKAFLSSFQASLS